MPVIYATVWGAQVFIDSENVSANVVGEITVEVEEGAARVADLTLGDLFGTTITLPNWTGKPVQISVVDMHTGVPTSPALLFDGVVDLPVVDMATRCLRLRCTDAFQEVVGQATHEDMDTLIGGNWSPVVFKKTASVFSYAQDLLSTVPASMNLDIVSGDLMITDWAAKAVADLSFDGDDILENSLVPTFAEQSQLINQIDLTFSYRFPRQKAEGYEVNYDFLALNSTSFGYWVRDGNAFLSRESVRSAIQSAGGSIVSEDWIELPTTGQVIPGLGGAPAGFWIPNPATDPLMCLGFSIVASFDYGQDIEETFNITVNNPASIAADSGPSAKA